MKISQPQMSAFISTYHDYQLDVRIDRGGRRRYAVDNSDQYKNNSDPHFESDLKSGNLKRRRRWTGAKLAKFLLQRLYSALSAVDLLERLAVRPGSHFSRVSIVGGRMLYIRLRGLLTRAPIRETIENRAALHTKVGQALRTGLF